MISGSESAEPFDQDYWTSIPESEKPVTKEAKEDTSGLESPAPHDESAEDFKETETDPQKDWSLKVTVLNVGQGSAAVLVSPGKTGPEYMVVDCGDTDHAQTIVSFLLRENPDSVRYLCLTHFDLDHIGGAKGVLKNFPVSSVWLSDYEADTRSYFSLMDYIRQNSVNTVLPKPGETFEFGECEITIVGPVKHYEEENSNSIAFIICDQYDNAAYFGGDATREAEEDSLNQGYLADADVLLVNHHGSSTSTSENFVAALSPEYAVISCDGPNGGYGHPTGRVLNTLKKQGCRLYRTDTQGDIIFYFERENGVRFEIEDPVENWEPGIYIETEEAA